MWPRYSSKMMQPSPTAWCSSNERRREGRRRAIHAQTNIDARRRREEEEEKEEEVQRLRGILYADDAGNVSRSLKGLEMNPMAVVTACSAFGLTVSETTTENMCL